MSKKLSKILIFFFLIFGAWILFLKVSRAEKVTEAVFPKVFLKPEEFCKDQGLKTRKFSPAQTKELLILINSLEDCTKIELGPGKFLFDSSFTIARTKGLLLQGAGKSQTIFQFSNIGNGNGIDVSNVSSFTIRDMSILDSPKNGLEIRNSENIIIHNILVSWSNTKGPEMSKNGAYGVYPVNVKNILLQKTESYYASDAGLYVGQCINAIVRENRAEKNVMGLEIENTINADVYDNVVINNTGGFLAYDLNKNTIVSRNIKVHHNTIQDNNNPNFASAGIVKTVPSGVGMVLTSVRDVEIFENTFGNNNTADIGIMNGLVSETPDFSKWPMNNWRVHDLYIHDNKFEGESGESVDNGNINEKDRPLGVLVNLVISAVNQFQKTTEKTKIPVSNIVYDGVDGGFTILQMTTYLGNKPGNHNQICIQNNTKGKERPSLIDINLPALLANAEEPTTESIAKAVSTGDVKIYKEEAEDFGGNPTKGFSCQGFQATGVPIQFPEI